MEVDVEGDDPEGFVKGCALIRSNLNIDPLSGSDEDWAQWYGQALWLEEMRLKNLTEILSRLFGSKRK